MGNPRRVYIYPPLPEDDGRDTSRFWPPSTAGRPELPDDQSPLTSTDHPEDYFAQGGGLLGMLLRGMQQGQGQPGADSSSAANDANGNGDAQGGLLGRLLALQAEQSPYQAVGGNREQAPSEPPDPNFRQVSRARVAVGPQGGMVNRSEDQSTPRYTPVRGDASFGGLPTPRQSDLATQPERTFSDRLQAYWDHPSPYGLVARVKEGLNGIAQAVQSSIDATSVPSTEEEFFRQNLAREQGPIAAWQALSLLNPTGSRGAGGVFARPSINAIANHGLPLRAAEPAARQGIDGLIANTGASTARAISDAHLPAQFRNPTAIESEMVPRGSIVPSNPTQTVPQVSGGLLRTYGDKPALPFISDAPGVQPEIRGTEAGKRRRGPPMPPPSAVPGFLMAYLAKQAEHKKRTGKYFDLPKSGGGGSRGGQGGTGGDGEDPCAERRSEEMSRCEARKLELGNEHAFRDDVLADYFQACKDRATTRWDLCNRNRRDYPRRRFPRFEPSEWGPADEESWFNENRERLPPGLFKMP